MNPDKTWLLWLVCCSCTDLPSTKLRLIMDASRQLFVSSRLDYCNSMLVGAADCAMQKFQGVQNAIERLITWSRRFDRIIPGLRCLHWLLVVHRITYKLAMLVSSVFAVRRHRILPSSAVQLLASLNVLICGRPPLARWVFHAQRQASAVGASPCPALLYWTVSQLIYVDLRTLLYLKAFVRSTDYWMTCNWNASEYFKACAVYKCFYY